ncbi:MAG TPA: pyruvate kinase [Firmicutes bacterium]|nr:pyruvate kinase [Bacillota bacterium]
MRRTKIVCTLGPSTDKPGVLEGMIKAGMDVARINASHGTHEEHAARINKVREAAEVCGKYVGIMLDLAGPKIRTGPIKGDEIELHEGAVLSLVPGNEEGDESRVYVNHPEFLEYLSPGSRVFLNDGLIELVVEDVREEEARCRVATRGVLASRKGVSVPGARVSSVGETRKDLRDIKFAAEMEADFIAASFVQHADDVVRIRALLDAEWSDALIIGKIESSEGVDNIESILRVADGIMVARGDLGIEMPAEQVPLLQKKIISSCNAMGKIVITATEMLESMVSNPRPTRAEVTDVACAIFDGTDAVMLSAETTIGKYPVSAVATMAKIAKCTEEGLEWDDVILKKTIGPARSVADAISHATSQTAHDLGVRAILTSTESGSTARMVSKYRPMAPIVAATPNPRVAAKLALAWGVIPTVVCKAKDMDDILDISVEAALALGVAEKGDLVIVTAGVRTGVPGTTNMLKVHRV